MINAQKPDHTNLTTMIQRLRDGNYVIPDFQRDIDWEPSDVKALMRSIFLDYYIGSLLLWKGKPQTFSDLSCKSIYGFTGDSRPTYIVLDGQQRLTAMHYVFIAPNTHFPHRRNRYLYYIDIERFMEEDYENAFHYAWTKSNLNILLHDRIKQFEIHRLPLSVVGAGVWELADWFRDYELHWTEKANALDGQQADTARRHLHNAQAFSQHIRDITIQYQISYIELDQDIELSKVCDIFTQINSRGIRLDAFDLLNALLRPKGIQLRHKLWEQAKSKLEFVKTARMNVYILQVMSILRQAYCSPKYLYYLIPGNPRPIRNQDGTIRREILIADTSEFTDKWNSAVKALEQAISRLRHPLEFGVTSPQYFPYTSILPAFAAIQAEAGRLSTDRQLDAQRKIRLWYWASVFTERYSGAVESTSTRDFLYMKTWFEQDNAEPAFVNDFRANFRVPDLKQSVRSGTSVYNGIFNLLVLRGARDWITGSVPLHDDLDDHHIVPKSWGDSHHLNTPIDSILNKTALTRDTNRMVIGDRLPCTYLKELVEQNGQKEVMDILESHFISPYGFEILTRNPFSPNDFEEFVEERQRTLAAGVRDLLMYRQLDLDPTIRDLDQDIERIELALRKLVASVLGDDDNRLPNHVQAKISQRSKSAQRNDPMIGLQTLQDKLTFADLREIQDTIVSKRNWALFVGVWKNKNDLEVRFQQFANLRNCLRHSRPIDEITRRDGEVAILWFQRTLNAVGIRL